MLDNFKTISEKISGFVTSRSVFITWWGDGYPPDTRQTASCFVSSLPTSRDGLLVGSLVPTPFWYGLTVVTYICVTVKSLDLGTRLY